ncbi:MAG: hypothetical protein AAB730_01770, partial [Patescibacteria group bacterium]
MALLLPKRTSSRLKTQDYDEKTVELLEEKAGKVIFETNIRILSSSKNVPETDRILKELEASFGQFQNPDGNSFRARELSGKPLREMIEKFSFRIFDERSSMPLSVEEISSIYHFPYSRKAAPQVRMLKAREAAPPVNLPKEGILLGESSFRGEEREVKITKDDRRRHFYIIGQTGTGKSALMQNTIVQDIRNGEGV